MFFFFFSIVHLFCSWFVLEDLDLCQPITDTNCTGLIPIQSSPGNVLQVRNATGIRQHSYFKFNISSLPVMNSIENFWLSLGICDTTICGSQYPMYNKSGAPPNIGSIPVSLYYCSQGMSICSLLDTHTHTQF
jgi:hypothetical protein